MPQGVDTTNVLMKKIGPIMKLTRTLTNRPTLTLKVLIRLTY
jgi:hypothetical protein